MNGMTFLEDFSSGKTAAMAKGESGQVDTNAQRGVFDDGYKCGWQDGIDSLADNDRDVRESLSAALQELNFTYFEARQHVMQSVRPVLQAMIEAVLPQLISHSLGGRVVEVLGALADNIEHDVVVCCAPETESMLKELLEASVDFPISIEVEQTLTNSQVVLKLNDGQTRVDLEATLDALRECVDTFFGATKIEEAAHA